MTMKKEGIVYKGSNSFAVLFAALLLFGCVKIESVT